MDFQFLFNNRTKVWELVNTNSVAYKSNPSNWSRFALSGAGTASTTTATSKSNSWFLNGGADAIAGLITSAGSFLSNIITASGIRKATIAGTYNPSTGTMTQTESEQNKMMQTIAIMGIGAVVLIVVLIVVMRKR